MKIGTLHSVKTHLGNQFNAKMYRIMYEDWEVDLNYWLYIAYGQHTNRHKLRGLIYNYRVYDEEFQDINDYDLIALSLNFDTYPSDFRRFVTAIINDLYKNFPILKQKEVIILAGNEVFEKRGSAEKVVQTAWDTAMGILNSVNPNIEVCSWNEKIRTSEEKKAFEEVLNNQQHKSVCKYVGIQSLETTPETMRIYTQLAQSKGYIVPDVELMIKETYRFSEIKMKFDNDRLLGIPIVFIGCPYISEQLADYNDMFNKYALSIGDFKKDKFKIIEYVQQFKDKKEEVMNKMLDDIIFGVIYKVGTKGIGVKRIQKIINMWAKNLADSSYTTVASPIDEDGLFGTQTEGAITDYQHLNFLTVDGIAGSETLTSMYNFMLKRYDK